MKQRAKTVKGFDGAEMTKMFNQMIGAEGGDPAICEPKFTKLVKCLQKFGIIYRLIVTTFERYGGLADVAEYVAPMSAQLAEYDGSPFVMADYLKLKRSSWAIHAVKICNFLVLHKDEFEKKAHACDFIELSHDLEMKILPFSSFCLRRLFTEFQLTAHEKEFIAMVLEKMYILGREVYELVTSPDINIKEFINMMSHALNAVQKHPKLSRCGDAFKLIKKSLGMFEDNFGEYFKDFIESGDTTIIMQNFIIDVSTKTKANLKVSGQFKEILKYYRDLSANNKNPEITKLLSKLNENIVSMESQNIKETK
jgi:hypothetical protein